LGPLVTSFGSSMKVCPPYSFFAAFIVEQTAPVGKGKAVYFLPSAVPVAPVGVKAGGRTAGA
jgi:hypothetical protein